MKFILNNYITMANTQAGTKIMEETLTADINNRKKKFKPKNVL